jgi:hypothetical protein
MAEEEDKEKCQKWCSRRDAVEDGENVLNVICHHSLKMFRYSVMLGNLKSRAAMSLWNRRWDSTERRRQLSVSSEQAGSLLETQMTLTAPMRSAESGRCGSHVHNSCICWQLSWSSIKSSSSRQHQEVRSNPGAMANFFWNNRRCFYRIVKLASCQIFSHRQGTYRPVDGRQPTWQLKRLEYGLVGDQLADWRPVGNWAVERCSRPTQSR